MTSTRASKLLAIVLGVVVMVVAVGMLSGCGDQPLAPTSELVRPDQPTAAGAENESGKFTMKLLRQEIKEAKKLIGPVGDSLVVCLKGRARRTGIVFPPAAVLQETEIEMKVVECFNRVDGMIYEYDFGPDGQQFAKTCTLFLELSGRNGKLLTLWWYNPETLDWEAVRTEYLKNGRVSFKSINHFSKYGITCRGGGGAS